MSTCTVCLNLFNPYVKPHLYRQTLGHNACVGAGELRDRIEELEKENRDLEVEVKKWVLDTIMGEEEEDKEEDPGLDPEKDPMEIL